MIISLIAAIDQNRGLGKNNQLLFKIPEDMKRFRALTTGHVVVMGRKTYESIGHPLPNRTNIVVTRDTNYKAPGCMVVHSLDEAIKKADVVAASYAADKQEIFIIGGGELYKQAIDKTDKLYLTLVEGVYDADTFFPEYSNFSKVLDRKDSSDATYTYTFVDLKK